MSVLASARAALRYGDAMNHLLPWFDGVAKGLAGVSVIGAITQEKAVAVSAAIAAVLATLVPHLIKFYRDVRAAKRIEDTADLDRRELEKSLRERYRLEERVKSLEERIAELNAARCPWAAEGSARCSPDEPPGGWLNRVAHTE